MFNCPLSLEKAIILVEQLKLTQNAYIVDIGCGEGEFLIRVVEQYEATGVGIDNNPDLIKIATHKAKKSIQSKHLSFICKDWQLFDWGARKADLIISIGSEFIFGGYQQTLQSLSAHLLDNGKLLIGTVFWKQKPPSEYLRLMGNENHHFDFFTTVDIAIESGFVPLYICRSNDDEWDDFESKHARERYLAAIQDDDDKEFNKTRNWQQGYLKWGINTMGFCFLLLQKR